MRPRTFAVREGLLAAARVDRHYNQLHSLKAGFTESYQGMGVKRTESGTLLLLKPGRMKWDYTSPPGKIFLLDGKFAWFYTRGDPRCSAFPPRSWTTCARRCASCSATPNWKRR